MFRVGGGPPPPETTTAAAKNNNKNKTRDWSQVSFNPTVISAQSCTSAKILACLFICLFAYRYPCLYSLFTLTLTDTFSLRKKDINFIKGRYYLSLDVFIPVTAKPLGKLGALTSPCKLITDIKTKHSAIPPSPINYIFSPPPPAPPQHLPSSPSVPLNTRNIACSFGAAPFISALPSAASRARERHTPRPRADPPPLRWQPIEGRGGVVIISGISVGETRLVAPLEKPTAGTSCLVERKK